MGCFRHMTVAGWICSLQILVATANAAAVVCDGLGCEGEDAPKAEVFDVESSDHCGSGRSNWTVVYWNADVSCEDLLKSFTSAELSAWISKRCFETLQQPDYAEQLKSISSCTTTEEKCEKCEDNAIKSGQCKLLATAKKDPVCNLSQMKTFEDSDGQKHCSIAGRIDRVDCFYRCTAK